MLQREEGNYETAGQLSLAGAAEVARVLQRAKWPHPDEAAASACKLAAGHDNALVEAVCASLPLPLTAPHSLCLSLCFTASVSHCASLPLSLTVPHSLCLSLPLSLAVPHCFCLSLCLTASLQRPLAKQVGSSKNFGDGRREGGLQPLDTEEQLEGWIRELAEDVAARLAQEMELHDRSAGLSKACASLQLSVLLYRCLYFFTAVGTSLPLSVLLYRCRYFFTAVCTSLSLSVLLYRCLYFFIAVCTSLPLSVLLYRCLYFFTAVCTSLPLSLFWSGIGPSLLSLVYQAVITRPLTLSSFFSAGLLYPCYVLPTLQSR